MRRYSLLLSSFFTCFLVSVLGFSSVPVNVTTVKKLIPVDVYFTGKVESIESTILGFGLDRGVVAETKKVGDIVVGSVYNSDGSIAKKGTVVASLVNDRQRAAYQSALLEYQNAKNTCDRDSKMRKSISKKDFEEHQIEYLKAKTNVLSAKADLDSTEIIAPYTGVVTAVKQGAPGKPIDHVAAVTRMNPMLVKIPFTSEIVDLVSKNNLVLVYPDSNSEAVPAWIETGDQYTIFAYVHNGLCSVNALLTPEQQKMPKVYMMFPVMHFYNEEFLTHIDVDAEKGSILSNLTDLDRKLLAVPTRAVHKDDKGEYVWRAIGQVAMDKNKGIDSVFTVEKVYIKTGKLRREFNYGANVALAIVDLEDAGKLKAGNILVLYGDKNIQSEDKVVCCNAEWQFLPGETVKVEIPVLTQPGFYVPSNCIVHESEGFNFVYAVENGKAKLIRVKLTGRADETYSIEGPGIKEGIQLVVFDNKKQVADMHDTCPIEVKGTIPPCEKIEHQRASPIVPYEEITFFKWN